MSYSLTLDFDSYDELCDFITQFKQFKEKQFKKKEKEFIDTYSNLTDIKDDNKEDKSPGLDHNCQTIKGLPKPNTSRIILS